MRKLLVCVVLCLSIINISASDRETSAEATSTILAYFDKLVAENIITIDNLNYLVKQEEMVNPLSQHDADASHAAFTHRENIRQILAKDKTGLLNADHIKSWAHEKIKQLQELQNLTTTVVEKTKPLYLPMEFVTLPAQQFQSS